MVGVLVGVLVGVAVLVGVGDLVDVAVTVGVGVLVGVAVVDRGMTSLSAVYCCYDPHCSRLGLGTYSILKQIELCRRLGLRHLYLGLHIAESKPMAYKARFRPHQRLLSGRWQNFE